MEVIKEQHKKIVHLIGRNTGFVRLGPSYVSNGLCLIYSCLVNGVNLLEWLL